MEGFTSAGRGIILSMPRLRVAIFLSTILIVGIVGYLFSLYARGYRFNQETGNFSPNGLLVANSDPNGASVLVNGELKTATNATIPLVPGTYDIEVKKDGLISWKKRLTINREEVTQINVTLFASAPSLSAITFSGVINPIMSPDQTKVLYGVPATTSDESLEKAGLWILETVNLPLGFNREPRRITDGNLVDATWNWSPDSREVMLTMKSGAVYILNTSEFVTQGQRVNVASQKELILAEWEEKKDKRLQAQLGKLPDELESIFLDKTSEVIFSPDENKILYTASGSATLKEGLIPPLPGSSTQKQAREIKLGKKYIFDIKEDRNFEVADATQPSYWLATSNHLLLPQKDSVEIMDYDGTNRQTVYTGSYIFPFAYPSVSPGKLMILTNLGASTGFPNLYSLGLR